MGIESHNIQPDGSDPYARLSGDLRALKEALARIRAGEDAETLVQATRLLKRIESLFREDWPGALGDARDLTGARLRQAFASDPSDIAFGRDGMKLASIGAGGEFRISDLAHKNLPGAVRALPKGEEIQFSSFSPSLDALATVQSGKLHLYRLNEYPPRLVGSLKPDFNSTFNGLACLDDRRIAVSRTERYGGSMGDSVIELVEAVWSRRSPALRAGDSYKARWGDQLGAPLVGPGGETLWSLEGRSVVSIEVDSGFGVPGLGLTGNAVHHLPSEKAAPRKKPVIAGASDAPYVVCGLAPGESLDLLRIAGTFVKSHCAKIALPLRAVKAALDGKGTRLAAADENGRISVLDISGIERGIPPRAVASRDAGGPVSLLKLSPCGSKLAAVAERDLVIFDLGVI